MLQILGSYVVFLLTFRRSSVNHLTLATTTVCFKSPNTIFHLILYLQFLLNGMILRRQNNNNYYTYIECIGSSRAHWACGERGQCRSIAFDK